MMFRGLLFIIQNFFYNVQFPFQTVICIIRYILYFKVIIMIIIAIVVSISTIEFIKQVITNLYPNFNQYFIDFIAIIVNIIIIVKIAFQPFLVFLSLFTVMLIIDYLDYLKHLSCSIIVLYLSFLIPFILIVSPIKIRYLIFILVNQIWTINFEGQYSCFLVIQVLHYL